MAINERDIKLALSLNKPYTISKKISLLFFFSFTFILILNLPNSSKATKISSLVEEEWKWSPSGDKIKTKWADDLDPTNVWTEYPRPQMRRREWQNLNGEWSYAITDVDADIPEQFDGKILVPFPIESSLSGVGKAITDKEAIWYEREFEIHENWKNRNIYINFGAVDWKCIVYINNVEVGMHTGGYTPFSFNITKYIIEGVNKIEIKVYDPTNRGYQPVGKQTINPHSIWYTSVSGIWQTVWLEPFHEQHVEAIEFNNDFDNKMIKVKLKLNSDKKCLLSIKLDYNGNILQTVRNNSNYETTIKIPDVDFHPWSPSEPNIYGVYCTIYDTEGKVLDSLLSYTTLRKIEQKKDDNGFYRIYLNNDPIFNIGVLDQGYWPDGLYTPPSEEAMISDIIKLKELGFNTIRKHIKIEPMSYYYYCDKLGMLIWQDMPSGDTGGNKWEPEILNGGTDVERSELSKENYYKEWGEIIDNLKFFQSIIVWVTFNEAWGQFETEKVVEFTKKKDPLRLINAASGGNHRVFGNILDFHNYPNPKQFFKEESLINVIGEYGGLGLEITGHCWNDDNWGYIALSSKEEVTTRYEEYIDELIELIGNGISGAIYTQTTDVESEINGLFTYDRKEIKIIEERIKTANEKIINSLK